MKNINLEEYESLLRNDEALARAAAEFSSIRQNGTLLSSIAKLVAVNFAAAAACFLLMERAFIQAMHGIFRELFAIIL